jgi:hypothetical protein
MGRESLVTDHGRVVAVDTTKDDGTVVRQDAFIGPFGETCKGEIRAVDNRPVAGVTFDGHYVYKK